MKKYRAIGLMSGTSLDGIDIAACEFTLGNQSRWTYKILHCHTYPYSTEWKEKLISSPDLSALEFCALNVEYGHLLGRLTRIFLDKTGFGPDLISSHGHTIFHQPDKGLTMQIGSGAAIAAETGLPVVCDFRSLDVALGGQGAPLVPIGDRLLFHEYEACLNLGGFANISVENRGNRVAYDICPVNIILNKLAAITGNEFDEDGKIARSGNVIIPLLEELNSLDYYQLTYPKSLGREWLEKIFLPVVNKYNEPANDLLRTICEHIAIQVNFAVNPDTGSKILATGGGVHNDFLMERIARLNIHQWVRLSDEISDFKEALVFAFLGVLRWRGDINTLASVTGCKSDHSGGSVYLGL